MSNTKGSVLAVDDEIYIQEILKSPLEDAGYECVAICNAEEALVTLASQSFDIALIDIRMPGKPETELLRDIKTTYPEDEQRRIQERTAPADDVLRPILDDEEVLKFIRHNREHYDGSGYPDRLRGNLIPLGARVISAVEAFDAITMGRPYRLPRSPEEAIKELVQCAQTQFDPQVVSVFADLYERVFKNESPPASEMA